MTNGRDLFEPKLGLTLPLCGLHFVFFFLVQANVEKAYGLFAFQPATAFAQPWTFFTFQFLTTSAIGLFFGTMLLYMLGGALEAEWGTREFTVFWLIATLGASGSALVLGQAMASGWVILDVSILFAYAYLYPETVFYIFFVIPVKVKWLAWLTAAFLLWRFFGSLASRGPAPALVELCGMGTGFLYFWVRHRGANRARRAVSRSIETVKSAGAILEDERLERRNRELFPKVEALRAVARGGAAPSTAFKEELEKLVVPGVKICKPIDFKGDKDGICVKCEGFAECSLRYIGGQPIEIVVKEREE